MSYVVTTRRCGRATHAKLLSVIEFYSSRLGKTLPEDALLRKELGVLRLKIRAPTCTFSLTFAGRRTCLCLREGDITTLHMDAFPTP